MARMILSRSKSAVSPVTTSSPSRRMVMRSAMRQRLLQRMADEDDRDAACLQPADQREEVALLLRRQRRGRLVEDDDLGLVVDGAGDLDHLPLGGAEASRPWPSDRPEIQRLQELLRGDIDAAQAVEELLVAEIEVLRHRHRRHQAGLLEHHGDAGVAAPHAARRSRSPGPRWSILPAGRLDDAGHDLGQRRLAGAVLAEQRMDLALAAGRSRRRLIAGTPR